MDQTTPQAVTTPRTPTTAPVLANLIITGSEAPSRFNNGMFGVGNIIPALVYTNTGGDVQPDGCTIDTTSSRPDLPAGLRAHPKVIGSNVTCQISGIPTEAATMATYYLTATNAIGTSEAVTVSFQVDLVRPLLADAPTEQSYTMGTAITPLTFTNTGLDVKTTAGCTVRPTLPLGLTLAAFDNAGTMTCQITGNPSAVAAKRTYVITATPTAGGTDEARVTITVAPDPLASPLLADIATEQSYTMGHSNHTTNLHQHRPSRQSNRRLRRKPSPTSRTHPRRLRQRRQNDLPNHRQPISSSRQNNLRHHRHRHRRQHRRSQSHHHSHRPRARRLKPQPDNSIRQLKPQSKASGS